jgi:hypothetical protein
VVVVADPLAASQGAGDTTIAESTGYNRRWIGQIAKRYSEQGPEVMWRSKQNHKRRGPTRN